ncbi:hypothetical protein AMAG_02582 [Allomyces macrogynus ATCC 38327]|uniref:Uncharacterized protein n=1 Tax=Allomyces macrogynus (strain ATCC 38327) TaxID=578462 RepID=A0A0L0S324_ALLM3|nr:hypothetical protein AMAG_02582 [Allomyces macrogynus ATCC 38327]|eukprot:KNE56806.1 hypothetical protein AMAG_02582 [Allomyces macrogynus ATCC 38327]
MASSQSWPVESPPRPRKRIQSTLHWALDPLDYDGPSHSHLVAAPKPGKPAASRDRPLPLARVKVRKTAQLTLPTDEIASGIPPPLAIPKPTIRTGPDVSQRTGFVPRAKAAGRRNGVRDVDDDDRMRAPAKPKPKPYDVAEVQAFMKKRRLQAKQFNVHDTIKDLDKPLHRVPSPPPMATPPTANRTEILQYILKRRERERREREHAQQLHDEAERKRAEQMRALEEFRRRQRVLEAEKQHDAAPAAAATRPDSASGAVGDNPSPGPSAASPAPVPTAAGQAVLIAGPMPSQAEPSPPIVASGPVLVLDAVPDGSNAVAVPTADSRPPPGPVFADQALPATAHFIHQPIRTQVVSAPRVHRPAPMLGPTAPPSARFVPNLGAIAEHQEHDVVTDAPSRRRRTVVSPSPLEDLERDLQAILEEDMVVHCETLQTDSTLRVLATSSPEASSLSLGLPPSHPCAPAVVSDPSSSSLHLEPVQSSGITNDLTDSRESLESTPRVSALGSVQGAPIGTRYSNHAEPQFGLHQTAKPPSVQQGHESPLAAVSSRPASTRPLDLYHPLTVFERTARRAEASAQAEPRAAYDAADDTSMFCSRSPSPRPTARQHAVKHSMVVHDDTAFLGAAAGALPPRGLSPIAHHQSPRRVPELIHGAGMGNRDTSFMRDLSHRVIQDHSEEELMAVERSSSVTPRPLNQLSGSFGEPPRSSVVRDSISSSALASDSGSFILAQPARATVLPPCDVSAGTDVGLLPDYAPSPTHPVYAPGALANGIQQSLHYAESLHLADVLLESIGQFRHVAALGGNAPGRVPAHWVPSGRVVSPPPPVALALSYSEDSAHLAAMVVAATSPLLGRTAPVLPPFSDSLLDAFAPATAVTSRAASPAALPAVVATSLATSPLVLPAATCHETANQTDPLPAPRRDMSVQTDPVPLSVAAPASPLPPVASPAASPAVSPAASPAPTPASVHANSTESLKEFLATQFQANQDLIKQLVNGQLAQRIRELEAKVEALQHAAVTTTIHPSPRPAASPRMDWVPTLPPRPFVPLSFAAPGPATSSPAGPTLDDARLPVAAPNAVVTLPEPVAVDPATENHRDAELDRVLYDWRDRVPSISARSESSGSPLPAERNVLYDRPSDVLPPSLETDPVVGQHPLMEQVDEGTRPVQTVMPLGPALDHTTSFVHDTRPDIGHMDLTMSLTLSPRKPCHQEEEPTAVRAPPHPHYFEPMSVISEPFAPTKSLLEALRNPSDSSISSLSVSAIGEDDDVRHDGSEALLESSVSSFDVSVVAEDAEIDHDDRGLHDAAVPTAFRDTGIGGVDARQVVTVEVHEAEEIGELCPSSSAASLVASSVVSRASRSVATSVATEGAASGTDSASSAATSDSSMEASVMTEGSALASRTSGRNSLIALDASLAAVSASDVVSSVLSGSRATGHNGDVSFVESEAESVVESERSSSPGSVLESDIDQGSIMVEHCPMTASSLPPSTLPSTGDPASHLPSTHPESGHGSAADTSIASRISPMPSHSSHSRVSTPSLSSRARTESDVLVAALQDDGHDGTSIATSVVESSAVESAHDQSRDSVDEESSPSLDGPRSRSGTTSPRSITSPSREAPSRSYSTVSDVAVDEEVDAQLDDSAAFVPAATATTAASTVPSTDHDQATTSIGEEADPASARSTDCLSTAVNQCATVVHTLSRSSSIPGDAPTAPSTHDDDATSVSSSPSVPTSVSCGLASSRRSSSSVHDAGSAQSARPDLEGPTESDVSISELRPTAPDVELASSIGLPKSAVASSSSIGDDSLSESHSAITDVDFSSSIGLPKSAVASSSSIGNAVLSRTASVTKDDATESVSSVLDGDQASTQPVSDTTTSTVEDGAADQPSVSVATDLGTSPALSPPAQEPGAAIHSDFDASASPSISVSTTGIGSDHAPAPTFDSLLAAAQPLTPTDASVATTALTGPASPTFVADHADALAAATRASSAVHLSSARRSVSAESQLTEATGLETSIAESLDDVNSSGTTEGSVSAQSASKSVPHGLDDFGSAIDAPSKSAHLPTRSELADASMRSLTAEPSVATGDLTSLAAPRDSVPTATQSAVTEHLDDATSNSASVAYSMEFDHDEPCHDDTGLAAFRGLGGVQDSDQSHVVLGGRSDDAHSAGDASIMDMASVMPTLHEIQTVPEDGDEGTRPAPSMHSSQRSWLKDGSLSPSMHSSQGSLADDGSDVVTASRSTVQSGSHDHLSSVAPDASDISYVASSFEDFSQGSAEEEAISPPISPVPILASVSDRSEHQTIVSNPEPVPIHELVDETTVPVETSAQPQEEEPLTPDQVAQHNLLAAAATEQLLDTLLHEVASEMAALHPSLQTKPTSKSPTTAVATAEIAPHMDVDYARNYLRFLLVHYHDTVHRTTPLVPAPHPVYRHAAWNTLLAAAADEARNHLFQRLGPSAWNAAVPAHWLYNEVVAVVAKNVQFAVDHVELDVVGMLTDDLRVEAAEARAQQQHPQQSALAIVSAPASSPLVVTPGSAHGVPAAGHDVVGSGLIGAENIGDYESWRRDKVDMAVDDLLDQLIFESVLGTTSLMAGMVPMTPEQTSRHS